jgi:hypothetical protein
VGGRVAHVDATGAGDVRGSTFGVSGHWRADECPAPPQSSAGGGAPPASGERSPAALARRCGERGTPGGAAPPDLPCLGSGPDSGAGGDAIWASVTKGKESAPAPHKALAVLNAANAM